MPAATRSNAIHRLLELLKAVPARSAASTDRLCQALAERGHVVQARTVQRDLRLLQSHFAIDCDERSKPFAWRWRTAAAREALAGLSTPEALCLVLVERHLKQALPASWSASLDELFGQARAALDRLGPSAGAARWAGRLRVQPQGLGLKPPVLPPQPVLAEVAEAVLREQQLQIRYRRVAKAGDRDYRLHPLGMLLRGQVLYVVALLHDRPTEEPRLFAVHRMQAAQRRPQACTVPAGMDFEAAMAQGRGLFGTPAGAPAIDLCLRCGPELAGVLEETPLGEGQSIREISGDAFELRVQLLPSWELRWWLLAHIDEIEVVAPVEWRAGLADRLRLALARHTTR